jgi:DNA-binding NtrC family response regulator
MSSVYSTSPILLVDDDPRVLHATEVMLRCGGFSEIVLCEDGRAVAGLMVRSRPDLVVLDLIMPRVGGVEICDMLMRDHPDVPVVIVTGNANIETAVTYMKKGAFDYLVKPVSNDKLVAVVRRALEFRQLRRENDALKEQFLRSDVESPGAFEEFRSRHPAMLALFRYAEAVAKDRAPILITGETGVGKEVMVRSLYRLGRYEGEMIGVNIAGLDDSAFSDTLFGHCKGAFTGADGEREGLIKRAERGLLYLDEVGDLSQELQVKLLRLLQEREYYPLGADRPLKSSCRMAFSTNVDLAEMTKDGRFRRDLYYRLSHHCLHIPPLRERLEDVPALTQALLSRRAREYAQSVPRLTPAALALLGSYDYPGNVRELEAMLNVAVTQRPNGQTLGPALFESHIEGERRRRVFALPATDIRPDAPECDPVVPFASQDWSHTEKPLPTLKEASELLIREALRRSQNNQALAARMLGVSRQALNRRLRVGR